MTVSPADRNAVLCLGRTYCDILFTGLERMPELGRECFARDVTLAAGGGAYITAAHLVARGRRAYLLSRLGLDMLSRGLGHELAASGIDMAFVEHAADAGPQPTVALVQGDERAFVSRRAGSSRPASLAAALDAADASHLHIAEFATLYDIADLIRQARARGLTVSLDPSWDDALIRHPDFLTLSAGIDLFLPNDAELQAITGCDDPDAGLDRLTDTFPLVVLKRGGYGAVVSRSGMPRIVQSAPKVDVVDTTGAGDAFNAGFIDAWLDRLPLDRCLAAAIATGSASVGQPGGAPRLG